MTPIEPSQNESEYNAVQLKAIETIRHEIRSSTSSMTAIPKPLKFLRMHINNLIEFYSDYTKLKPTSPNKPFISDILSVLSMTLGSDERLVLKYCLEGSKTDISGWGYEYLRSLSGEIGVEHNSREEDAVTDDLDDLIDIIIAYFFVHGGELEGCDLLLEVGQLHKCLDHVQREGVERVGKYLFTCTKYITDVEEQDDIFQFVTDLYQKHELYVSALIVLLRRNNHKDDIIAFMKALVDKSVDEMVIQQCCYVMSSAGVCFTELEDILSSEQYAIVGNTLTSQHFKYLLKELDVLAPKSPADVYKVHLEEGVSARRLGISTSASTAASTVDNALENQAKTFVNALVNVGSGQETLLLDNSEWLFRHKDIGRVCATASIGLVNLWNTEEGFTEADKYSFSKEDSIQGGSLLASGVLSTGVTSEMNATFALLSDHVTKSPEAAVDHIRDSAILGLGISYANTQNQDVLELLLPVLLDESASIECIGLCVYALGLVFTSSADDNIVASVLQVLIDRIDRITEKDASVVKDKEGLTVYKDELCTNSARLICIGVALLYLNTNVYPESVIESFAVLQHPIQQYLTTTVESFAFAGTGNMLQLQKLLSLCGTKSYDDDDDDVDMTSKPVVPGPAPAAAAAGNNRASSSSSSAPAPAPAATTPERNATPFNHIHQSAAVIGIAALGLNDDITTQMLFRQFDHLLQYGQNNIRRAIPLALALHSQCNPQLQVTDLLSKLTHDQDQFVSMHAVFALGLVGAGTNNSRIADTLRGLAAYFQHEPQHLYVVRIAQGLLHLGKGLCGLNSFVCDGNVFNKRALAGILSLLHMALDMGNVLIVNQPYLLFVIALSISPRFVVTIDEEGQYLPISVRVGQAVDTVGQPGKPRTLTGFQTHQTPVLLAVGERCEFATDDYLSTSPILEGVVIVKKNPEARSTEL